ncbi:uncharacterized protein TNCV_4367121 [Trichonephila clavipes]|nr:uncharacterized protein TNCV_4367121 [Trichonephila clavipes]
MSTQKPKEFHLATDQRVRAHASVQSEVYSISVDETVACRVTAEIRERFQQLQNLAQKYAFLRPEVILSMDELNFDQAPQDINKKVFQLEHVRPQAFVAATDPGCKKELIRSGSLGV